MKQVIEGGRVEIMINGQPGNYFRIFKGLRQGDVAEPPKLYDPHAPVIVSKTSDGYACAP
jgi:hypothetical protein